MNRLNRIMSHVPWPPRCPFGPRMPVCDGPATLGLLECPCLRLVLQPLSPLKSSPKDKEKSVDDGMFLIYHYQKPLTAQTTLISHLDIPLHPCSPSDRQVHGARVALEVLKMNKISV